MMKASIESLKSAASEQTGLDDFGCGVYAEPLQAWAKDLNGSNLNERGKEFFKGLVVADLSKRLKLVQCFKDYPEIEGIVVPPILYITGHERSGTTLLHNLLCLHPKSRAFLRWELMQPAPPPEASTYHSDPRIAQVQAPIDKLKGSLLEQLHWVNADEPEECAWGLWNCSGMLGQAVSFVMPNWFQWLHEADFTPTLEEYRCLVKLLLWRNPVPNDGFLVLKCPQFLWNLESFSRIFPEARLQAILFNT